MQPDLADNAPPVISGKEGNPLLEQSTQGVDNPPPPPQPQGDWRSSFKNARRAIGRNTSDAFNATSKAVSSAANRATNKVPSQPREIELGSVGGPPSSSSSSLARGDSTNENSPPSRWSPTAATAAMRRGWDNVGSAASRAAQATGSAATGFYTDKISPRAKNLGKAALTKIRQGQEKTHQFMDLQKNIKEISDIYDYVKPEDKDPQFHPYSEALNVNDKDDYEILTSKVDFIAGDILRRLIHLFRNPNIRSKYKSDVSFKRKFVFIVMKISEVVLKFYQKTSEQYKQNPPTIALIREMESKIVTNQFMLTSLNQFQMFRYIYTGLASKIAILSGKNKDNIRIQGLNIPPDYPTILIQGDTWAGDTIKDKDGILDGERETQESQQISQDTEFVGNPLREEAEGTNLETTLPTPQPSDLTSLSTNTSDAASETIERENV